MSSSAETCGSIQAQITNLKYRDLSAAVQSNLVLQEKSQGAREGHTRKGQTETTHSDADIVARIERGREDAARETEKRMRAEYEQKLLAMRGPIAQLLAGFKEKQDDYFARVEAEVIQLALSIAAKILHRESQVDPMLVAALVRVAIEKMREGTSVTIRVCPNRAESWRQYFAEIPSITHVEVVEDAHLGDYDCMAETELGAANFRLDTQLKEVEQGFFDLLALRPGSR